MTYQDQPFYEIYNENLQITELILKPVKSVIAPNGQTVIERSTQEFFIKNISSYSYIVRVISSRSDVIVTKQPNVIHPTRFQSFIIEFDPTDLEDLDGVIHFEIEPL